MGIVSPNIAIKIQQTREELGIIHQELAARLGCTQETLSSYELGKRRRYLTNLERIDNALGKPLGCFTEPAADEDEIPTWPRYPYR